MVAVEGGSSASCVAASALRKQCYKNGCERESLLGSRGSSEWVKSREPVLLTQGEPHLGPQCLSPRGVSAFPGEAQRDKKAFLLGTAGH